MALGPIQLHKYVVILKQFRDNSQKSVISHPPWCHFPLCNVILWKRSSSFLPPDNITLSASHTDMFNPPPSTGAVSDTGLFHWRSPTDLHCRILFSPYWLYSCHNLISCFTWRFFSSRLLLVGTTLRKYSKETECLINWWYWTVYVSV